MDVLPDVFVHTIKKQGRHASATVSGQRREGFLIGNKFFFSDESEFGLIQVGPGEYRELRIWRK